MPDDIEVTDEQIEAYIRRKTVEMQDQQEAVRRRKHALTVKELSKGGIFSEMWTFWQDSLLQLRGPKGATRHARLIQVADTPEGRMAELAVVASSDAAYRDVIGIEHMPWPPTDGSRIRVLRSA